MIEYSIAMYNQTVGKNPGPKAYGRAQMRKVMGFDEIAEHISSHNSKYNEGDIHAVLVEVVKCIHEFLLDGNKVELGRLGAFWPTLRCTPAESIAEFTADNIKHVTVNWAKGAMFKDMRAEAVFNYVPTRADQQLLKKAVKKGSTTVDLTKPEKNQQGNGNDNDNNEQPTPSGITITALSADESKGTVSGSGTYVEGATVTLQATPAAGYKFSQWQDGNTANPRQVTASATTTYTATFVVATPPSGSGGMMGD